MPATKINRKFPLIISLAAVIILAATAILVGLTRPQNSTLQPTLPAIVQSQVQGPESKAFQVTIETSRITEYVDGKMVIYVPEGAFDITGTISVFTREPDLFPEAGKSSWRRPVIIDVEFQDPDGKAIPDVKFSKPLQICAALSEEGWKQYTTIRNDFQIQYYNDSGSVPQWEELYPSNYSDKHQLCGRTMHLSLFALAVWGDLPPVSTPTIRVYEP